MLGTPCGTPSPQPLAALLPQPNLAPDPDTPGSGGYNCQFAPLSLFSLLLAYQQWRVVAGCWGTGDFGLCWCTQSPSLSDSRTNLFKVVSSTDFSVCVFKVPAREIPHLSHGQVSLRAVITPSIAGFFHSWGFFSAQSVKAWTIAP
jgi:hypothetical protein